MPISDNFDRVAVSQIWVDRDSRQRREIKTEDLEQSIARNGLINPIIITREFELKAGERRWTACKNLGHETIICRFVDDLSPIEAQLIELEENLKRTDLDWKDVAYAIGKVHDLHRALDPDWTMAETAEVCSLVPSMVTMNLKVRAELENNVRVAQAGTMREAYNILNRRDQRAMGNALQELLDAPEIGIVTAVRGDGDDGADANQPDNIIALPSPQPRAHILPVAPIPIPPPAETILHQSFLDWACTYSGPKFNFIHCDFPYGIDLFSGPQGRGAEPSGGYGDGKDVYFALLECFCKNLDRFMSLSAHLVFWYSETHGEATRELFRRLAPGLKFNKFPLIWVKSDNAGISSDPSRTPRHVYETALVASRGDRRLVQVKADAYICPSDRKLHPSTKPEPMLKHFFTMFVDEHTMMLDPTAGSGAAIRAAEFCGASRVLGLEIDEQYLIPARQALQMARSLRRASAIL